MTKKDYIKIADAVKESIDFDHNKMKDFVNTNDLINKLTYIFKSDNSRFNEVSAS